MRFTKQATTIAEQIALWKSRGLEIASESEAERFLRFVGYYRLSGYVLTFTNTDHIFRDGTTFEKIQNLYVFDRELRLLVLDAIERVEVAFRTCVSNFMSCEYGPHWYMDSKRFSNRYSRDDFVTKTAKACGYDDNGILLRERVNDVFLTHYLEKYDTPKLPPSWMVAETVSITTWSRAYCEIHRKDRKAISQDFGLSPEVLESWMHSVCHVRNLCAHHSRLWNRTFGISPLKARGHEAKMGLNNRFHAAAYVIRYLLETAAPKATWWSRLIELVDEQNFNPKPPMGFPDV